MRRMVLLFSSRDAVLRRGLVELARVRLLVVGCCVRHFHFLSLFFGKFSESSEILRFPLLKNDVNASCLPGRCERGRDDREQRRGESKEVRSKCTQLGVTASK